MELRDSPEERDFRAGLRAWLEANRPAGWSDRHPDPAAFVAREGRAWSRRLHEAGYAGLTWPERHGGAGAPWSFQAIYLQELARAGAPGHVGVVGVGMVGPTIMAHGTDAQMERHLPRILSGDEVFCLGFSEPGAGSDLAALRTTAVRDGDDLVVDGQKVWVSNAHLADWCLLLARSGPETERELGTGAMTCLLVDLRGDGVAVRPLRQLTGRAEFGELTFTGARVPAGNVVGRVGDGWRVAMTTLRHERGVLGFSLAARFEVLLRRLVELAGTPDAGGRRAADDPLVRDRVARLWIDLQGLRYTSYRTLGAMARDGAPGPEGSVLKLHWSEANQRLTALALELLGPAAQLDGEDGAWGGFWQYQQLRSRGNTIEAGTSEVQRNAIAEQIIGLPRGR